MESIEERINKITNDVIHTSPENVEELKEKATQEITRNIEVLDTERNEILGKIKNLRNRISDSHPYYSQDDYDAVFDQFLKRPKNPQIRNQVNDGTASIGTPEEIEKYNEFLKEINDQIELLNNQNKEWFKKQSGLEDQRKKIHNEIDKFIADERRYIGMTEEEKTQNKMVDRVIMPLLLKRDEKINILESDVAELKEEIEDLKSELLDD